MKIVGFNVRKPKAFSYKPLYYDEKKEQLEKLKKKYEDTPSEGGVSPDFREKLRSSWHVKEKRTGNISRTTLLIYFAFVLLLIYFIFLK